MPSGLSWMIFTAPPQSFSLDSRLHSQKLLRVHQPRQAILLRENCSLHPRWSRKFKSILRRSPKLSPMLKRLHTRHPVHPEAAVKSKVEENDYIVNVLYEKYHSLFCDLLSQKLTDNLGSPSVANPSLYTSSSAMSPLSFRTTSPTTPLKWVASRTLVFRPA